MEEINTEKIIEGLFGIGQGANNTTPMDYGECKLAMKEACKQVLELAAKNSETKTIEFISGRVHTTTIIVNKQSILNIINQVK